MKKKKKKICAIFISKQLHHHIKRLAIEKGVTLQMLTEKYLMDSIGREVPQDWFEPTKKKKYPNTGYTIINIRKEK